MHKELVSNSIVSFLKVPLTPFVSVITIDMRGKAGLVPTLVSKEVLESE